MMMIKRDPLHPSKYYVEPPLYGPWPYHQRQGRNNYSSMRDKQHMSRAEQRSDVGSQPSTPSPASFPWRAAIPGGTDVCLHFGQGSLSSKKRGGPTSKPGNRQKGGGNHHQGAQNEILRSGNKEKAHSPFLRVPPSSPSLSPRMGGDKKKFFNVMWEPRVARGTTMVSFATAQQAKCKHHFELNRTMHFRDKKSRQRQRRGGDGGKPSARIHAPNVEIIREPLSYSAFAPFLTDSTDTEYKDRGQSTTEDFLVDPMGPSGYRKNYASGVSREVPAKTENEPCRASRTEWIVSSLTEKIPEQALLEVMEETEIGAIRGQVHKYEMKMLYQKWHEMKEDQWNEWLAAWEKLRNEEIDEEERILEYVEESIAVMGFSRGAISYCYTRTSENMKTDGYIEKTSGVPFEELDNIGKYLKIFEDEAKKRLENIEIVSREVADTTIVRAVVHRFGHHMRDDFGKPHGIWLSRRQKGGSVDFDEALGYYLEHSYLRRNKREQTSVASIDSDFDPVQTELFDQTTEVIAETFRERANRLGSHGGRRLSLKEQKSPVNAAPPQNIKPVENGGGMMDPKRTSQLKEEDSSLAVASSNSTMDDLDILFKRNTSWSELEKHDEEGKRKSSKKSRAPPELDKLEEIQGGENGTDDDNAPS